jgi:hypothetical protein
VSPADYQIDLGLRIATARLKVLDQPAQDHHPLLVLRWDAQQGAAGANEVRKDPCFVLGFAREAIPAGSF